MIVQPAITNFLNAILLGFTEFFVCRCDKKKAQRRSNDPIDPRWDCWKNSIENTNDPLVLIRNDQSITKWYDFLIQSIEKFQSIEPSFSSCSSWRRLKLIPKKMEPHWKLKFDLKLPSNQTGLLGFTGFSSSASHKKGKWKWNKNSSAKNQSKWAAKTSTGEIQWNPLTEQKKNNNKLKSPRVASQNGVAWTKKYEINWPHHGIELGRLRFGGFARMALRPCSRHSFVLFFFSFQTDGLIAVSFSLSLLFLFFHSSDGTDFMITFFFVRFTVDELGIVFGLA